MEHKSQPLASLTTFYTRVGKNLLIGGSILILYVVIGAIGYHVCGRLDWVESIYNAAMIASGMGPVDPLPTDGAKIFASAYAVVSGVIFIGMFGYIASPIFHRIFHKLNIETNDEA